MIRVIFFSFLLFLLMGCSKKATVSTYSTANVSLKNLQYINLNIEGSELFQQRLHERIPIMFLAQELLVDDPSSKDILHIIENPLRRNFTTEDSEDTKDVRRFVKIYHSDTKRYETQVRYVERTYYTRCWIDTFELGASVTTRFKRDTLLVQESKKTCRTKRFGIFHKPQVSYDESSIYNSLVTKLRDRIINYLIPYTVYYKINLEEDLDVAMTEQDQRSFEQILEHLDNSLALPSMIDTLEVLSEKYPNSYTIHFTTGVLYEIFARYDEALLNYQKALEITPSKKVLQRIQKVKENSYNLEKIKG